MPSSTIHRFLKWNKENNKFGINEHNKVHTDLVIVDEASMVYKSIYFRPVKINVLLIIQSPMKHDYVSCSHCVIDGGTPMPRFTGLIPTV